VKGEKTDLVTKLRTAQSRLMKGAKTKAVAKKSAARKISRLTKQVAALTK
jgi:ribosomal protein S20